MLVRGYSAGGSGYTPRPASGSFPTLLLTCLTCTARSIGTAPGDLSSPAASAFGRRSTCRRQSHRPHSRQQPGARAVHRQPHRDKPARRGCRGCPSAGSTSCRPLAVGGTHAVRAPCAPGKGGGEGEGASTHLGRGWGGGRTFGCRPHTMSVSATAGAPSPLPPMPYPAACNASSRADRQQAALPFHHRGGDERAAARCSGLQPHLAHRLRGGETVSRCLARPSRARVRRGE